MISLLGSQFYVSMQVKRKQELKDAFETIRDFWPTPSLRNSVSSEEFNENLGCRTTTNFRDKSLEAVLEEKEDIFSEVDTSMNDGVRIMDKKDGEMQKKLGTVISILSSL